MQDGSGGKISTTHTGISVLPLWRRWKAGNSIIDIAIGVRFVRRETANRDCADPAIDLCSRYSAGRRHGLRGHRRRTDDPVRGDEGVSGCRRGEWIQMGESTV